MCCWAAAAVLTRRTLTWVLFQDECYNYIKVLVPRDDETLFACGTNAFDPACRNYKAGTFAAPLTPLLAAAVT